MSDDIYYDTNDVFNSCTIDYNKKIPEDQLKRFKRELILYFSTFYDLKYLYVKRMKKNIKEIKDILKKTKKSYYYYIFYDDDYKMCIMDHKYIGSTILMSLTHIYTYNTIDYFKYKGTYTFFTVLKSLVVSLIRSPKVLYDINKLSGFSSTVDNRCFYEKLSLKEKNRYYTINYILNQICDSVDIRALKCWIPVGFKSTTKNVNNVGILPFIYKKGMTNDQVKKTILANSCFAVSSNICTKLVGKINSKLYTNICEKTRKSIDVVLSMINLDDNCEDQAMSTKHIKDVSQSFTADTKSYPMYIFVGCHNKTCYITYRFDNAKVDYDKFLQNKNIIELKESTCMYV